MPGHMPAITTPSRNRRSLSQLISCSPRSSSQHSHQAPRGLHGGKTRADDTDRNDDPAHPHPRTESRHDQVTWEVEHHVSDVEQRESSGGLLGGQVQRLHEVVVGGRVHGLGKPDVGADG